VVIADEETLISPAGENDRSRRDAAHLDYLHEVEHMSERITRWKSRSANLFNRPYRNRKQLQAMRGVVLISVVTNRAEPPMRPPPQIPVLTVGD
jgi:hypothetical protein